MTRHIMVDIETMGKDPGCAVVSIGAVTFDPTEPFDQTTLTSILERGQKPLGFKVNISLESCLALGLGVHGDTIEWWLTQSPGAREALAAPPPTTISNAIQEFDRWARMDSPDPDDLFMWAHATFDTPILHAVYRLLGKNPPWHYRNTRDLRTLQDLAYGYGPTGENVPIPSLGRKHDALWDAYRQALIAQKCYERLSEGRQTTKTGTIKLGDVL